MSAFVLSLRSIALHERSHKGNPELAGVIDGAADEIERLCAAVDIARTALLIIERQSEDARALISRTIEARS